MLLNPISFEAIIFPSHDSRSEGIFNKSKFNTAKIAQFAILPWTKFRPDMHQAFMVSGHYTKYE